MLWQLTFYSCFLFLAFHAQIFKRNVIKGFRICFVSKSVRTIFHMRCHENKNKITMLTLNILRICGNYFELVTRLLDDASNERRCWSKLPYLYTFGCYFSKFYTTRRFAITQREKSTDELKIFFVVARYWIRYLQIGRSTD